MKKFIYTFAALFSLVAMSSCSGDLLNTEPTDSMSGTTLLADGERALVPLNGIYRSMYTAGWSTTGNIHQCFGISALIRIKWDVRFIMLTRETNISLVVNAVTTDPTTSIS